MCGDGLTEWKRDAIERSARGKGNELRRGQKGRCPQDDDLAPNSSEDEEERHQKKRGRDSQNVSQ